MEIYNDTPFEVEAIPCLGPEGRTVLTIIVKGTFDISSDEPAAVASEQIPVAFGDEFYDENEGGSVKFESDVAPFKPRADIALVGRAYAPPGKAVRATDVALRVGHVKKIIRVIGDRRWKRTSRLMPEHPTKPQPFSVMDLVYERAFGGIDREGGGFCSENLVGRGFFAKKSKDSLDGALLPNLENPNNLIKSWKDHPKPVGFGFYGKAWMPRAGHLGTYDDKWRKERSPDPPEDFRFDYYNAAHPDLQVEGYLKGDEEVELVNLSPGGNIRFQLPVIRLTCTVTKSPLAGGDEMTEGPEDRDMEEGFEEDVYEDFDQFEDMDEFDEFEDADEYEEFEAAEESLLITEEVNLNLDTLCLIPDEKRLYLVWRGLCSINDLTALEVKTVEIT